MKSIHIKKLILSAMFLALGIVLPFLTGQIQIIGNMLLPMHIPVMLCGLICGWQYGIVVGFITPLLRSAMFTMPVMFPGAIAMAFELATYAGVVGYLYSHARWQCVKMLYRCMIVAMLVGRIVWGIAMAILLSRTLTGFSVYAFISGAFINAIPGIILQLIVIPAVMVALNKTKLVPFRKHNSMHKKKTAH
ncbi:MAG: ECF transporter S component [Clostridia bacterium]|nr:ECF transporter S component [Clostridia bacterium]